MFAVLTFNLGSWFNESTNTVLADHYINTSEDQNNNKQNDDNIHIENNNQSQTEDVEKVDGLEIENNNENETEIENRPDNNYTDSNSSENEQKNEVTGET